MRVPSSPMTRNLPAWASPPCSMRCASARSCRRPRATTANMPVRWPTRSLICAAKGALRISHLLHLRAEMCSETLVEELEKFGPDDSIGIVSLMDHTPGQRQFRDVTKLKDYVMGKHGYSADEFQGHIAAQQELGRRNGARHEAAAVAAARRYGAVLASHDDTTADQVARSAQHGAQFRRVSDDGRGGAGLSRPWHQGDDGRAEPDPGRVAFRQCRRADAGGGGASRYRVVRLRALGPACRRRCGWAISGAIRRAGSPRSRRPRRRRRGWRIVGGWCRGRAPT